MSETLLDNIVELATIYKDRWGDGFHHMLANEIVLLRLEVAALKKAREIQ